VLVDLGVEMSEMTEGADKGGREKEKGVDMANMRNRKRKKGGGIEITRNFT